MDRTRRPALDGLRALAALGVVVHHAWQYSGHPAPWNLWLQLSLGVALFFCLSGFLVYGPWARGRPPRLGRFYALRAARVLPLYYLTLAASVALLYGTGHWRYVDDWRLLGFAVLAQNYVPSLAGHLNPPTWTLAIEVTFYAVVPLIALLARRRPLPVLLALTVASVVWSHLTPEPAVVRQTLLDVFGLFGVGMIARVLVEGRELSRRLSHGLFVAGAALVWAAAAHGWGVFPAGVGFAAIVVACASPMRRGCSQPARWPTSARSPTGSTCGTTRSCSRWRHAASARRLRGHVRARRRAGDRRRAASWHGFEGRSCSARAAEDQQVPVLLSVQCQVLDELVELPPLGAELVELVLQLPAVELLVLAPEEAVREDVGLVFVSHRRSIRSDMQKDRWKGASGSAWVELQAVTDQVMAGLVPPLVDGLSGSVLDVGCGTGVTTVAAAKTADRPWGPTSRRR